MTTLQRSLRLGDAVAIGVASMLGAGVFAAFGPAASSAGEALLAALVLAGLVAFANATSSAQLAAQYPTAGGTYVYGREQVGPWTGFVAGWGFVVGKTASCAAMALTVASYALPSDWVRPGAVAVVWLLVSTNLLGVTRTARAAMLLAGLALAAIAAAVVHGWGAPGGGAAVWGPPAEAGWYGVLQAAGLLFFAFAGYARIATLGEEVERPRRTIPRAITLALALVLVVYAVVGVTLLAVLGAPRLAGATQPLLLLVDGSPVLTAIVVVGAVAAASGALLSLLAGISRTGLAMAREGDLPHVLAAIHPSRRVPHRLDLALGVVLTVVVLVLDLRGAIGFSSFGVLVYYLVANVSAVRQASPHRLYPRALQWLGIVLCLVLLATLPPVAVAGGLLVIGLGVGVRALRLRHGRRDRLGRPTTRSQDGGDRLP